MDQVRAFAQLTRPVFLLGGVLLFGLGTAISPGPVSWTHYAIGQALVTATQLSAQYANEYFDVEADRLAGGRRTWLTGGSGVLATGRLALVTARRAAATTAVASLVLATVVAGFSVPAALVGLAALAGAWMYSAPPARLVAGWYGVTAASLIVAVLTPLTGALVQGSVPVDRFVALVLPLLLLHHAMLIAFERPDVEGDAAAGKRTLSVRLGPTRSARLHGFLTVGSYAALAGAALLGPLPWRQVGWGLALAPLGLVQVLVFSRGSDTVLATVAVGLFSGTALGLLGGVV